MTDSVLHQACGQLISEAEEKAIVDKWLRGVRSKGGKSRWKNHEPAPKDRPAPPAVHPTRWATRRENQFRKSLVDGISPWNNGIRLLSDFSGLGEALQAEYSFHSHKSSAIFFTGLGFQKAWEQARAWIVQKRKEVKAQRTAKKKEKA
jgi:hypothetical protein